MSAQLARTRALIAIGNSCGLRSKRLARHAGSGPRPRPGRGQAIVPGNHFVIHCMVRPLEKDYVWQAPYSIPRFRGRLNLAMNVRTLSGISQDYRDPLRRHRRPSQKRSECASRLPFLPCIALPAGILPRQGKLTDSLAMYTRSQEGVELRVAEERKVLSEPE